ncbi:MAG: dienelactone hydrolase family protein [Parvibaculum sp.]|jgi:carboxymethylenebutenolidase|uniref:dienelactone hydrolase family protein n=1 Tax=Parvibaculum sp. TaxID=2024848 RepID=UPI00283EA164|nr:dienelactone hydrolase family protein [Parvibaculum sp.]MDR3499813.1 dienelactone hydrolase family protein [Parvibaculum sp.]
MKEEIVQIETPAGAMETFTARPGDGAYPAVILYMDAPGIREELYDFARRIAAEGYYVLLPDMYYRRGRLRFDMGKMDDAMRKRMFEAMLSINNKLVMDDTRAMLAFLAKAPGAKPGKRGCIGYCMSGQYVVSAAGTFPDDFAAAASLYGVGIVTAEADSPHRLADRIKGELYLGFAGHDPYVPDNVIPDLKAALDAHRVAYRLDVWPGTEHGFCFPQRAAYAESAAEEVWKIVFDLYRRKL